MKHLTRISVLAGCFVFFAGCASSQPDTFTFTADMPPNFVYTAIAIYRPAKGETCTVTGGRNTGVGYNMKWRENYQPNAQILLRRTVSGCPLVINRVELEIYRTYGKDRGDFGADGARVFIHDKVKDQYINVFNEAGESTFSGECQTLFRTVGPKRRIVKLLNCKTIDPQGERGRHQPFSMYTLDQLPGKTVKMHIRLAEEEKPGWGDTWVRVPNGWKRCIGRGYEDQRGYCKGNYTDFSTFQMPDGRQCTIYPGCTE